MNRIALVSSLSIGLLTFTTGCTTYMKSNTFQERVGLSGHTLDTTEALAWMREVEPYAVMAELAYKPVPEERIAKMRAKKAEKTRNREASRATYENWFATNQWTRVTNAASGLPMPPDKDGLYFDVWMNTSGPTNRLVVAFRGTEVGDWNDWMANLRWFIPRCIRRDEYVEAEELLGPLLEGNIGAATKPVEIITTGHSLGGGLAQHVFYHSYTLKPGARATQCYAFDPSPVTGWWQGAGAKKAREDEMRRLAGAWKSPEPMLKQYHFGTVRVYERGEILQSVRAFLRWFLIPSKFITEVQCNFVRSGNGVEQHSMSRLASGIFNYTEGGGEQSKPVGK